jgi:hypothetical protein
MYMRLNVYVCVLLLQYAQTCSGAHESSLQWYLRFFTLYAKPDMTLKAVILHLHINKSSEDIILVFQVFCLFSRTPVI